MADKIAIFGGSFNPIHNGHIEVALSALKECGLKKVIFLPNANPPHKDRAMLVSALHRYNMVSLAAKNISGVEVSDYEMKNGPSYTIDTMRHFKKIFNADLYFVIGADSLYTLHTWKSFSDLIHECKFIVADRNCNEGNNIEDMAEKIRNSGGNITVLKMEKYDVTSTLIRQKISCGKDVSEYISSEVNQYIKDNNLYKSKPEAQNDN